MTDETPPLERDDAASSSQLICPRCGSARSKAATFCGVCGQDLRQGAPVVPLTTTAPEPPAGVRPSVGRGLLRRPGGSKPGPEPDAPGTALPGDTPGSTTGVPAAGPLTTLPGSNMALPKEQPLPKPTSAVLPKDESNLSFSERYRGTEYSNPDIERFLPPTPQQVRRGRIRGLLTGLVAVALLVGAVAAAWLLFLAPGAQFGLGPSPSPTAAASATPRPTPTPSPSINGLLPDEVEIAACLMLSEDAGQAADLGELQADIEAERTADLPARVDGIAAAIGASRSSLAALESREETAALAAAWAALYGLETEVLDAIGAAAEAGDAKALAGAAERLGEADAARAAVVDAHDALVAAFPEASCVVEAQ